MDKPLRAARKIFSLLIYNISSDTSTVNGTLIRISVISTSPAVHNVLGFIRTVLVIVTH